LVLAFQFNESALVRHLNVIFAIAARNTEIRVRCQIGAQDKAVPILATRQLSVPFGSIPVVATPEDVPAFLANVRLQTQLYRVGGGLLLISVVAGIWLMWREVSSEMRLARERSDFAATVSHDLRTPLSSMRMLAESLYLGNVADEGKRKKFLATIIKESDRLSRLTDRALYFIRYGQGALRYQFTEGDFGGVVREAVENFVVGVGGTLVGGADVLEVSDEKASPRVVVEIEPDLPQIRFDAGAMEQVVYNLLDNAVKYSREGEEWPSPQPSPVRGEGEDSGKGLSLPPRPFGERVGVRGAALSVGEATIHVKLVSEAGQIILSVEDQGVGLSSEEVQQVLNPYARGRRAGRLNARGVGLGLALCQHVVQAHGGRIQIRSVPGQGSTFSVILPV
jgi:signal transduction histidine kinase